MKTIKAFIGNLISKVPGINDLVLSIVNLTMTIKQLCAAVNDLLAAREAHEAAIIELYARQGAMMRILNPEEGREQKGPSQKVAQKLSTSKVSKPNLGDMINDTMPSSVASFLKKYWSHLLLVVVLVASTLVLRSQKNEFVNDMQKVQEAHVVEIQKIQDARVEERKLLEANVKKLEQTLSIVQQQYDSAKKDLDAKKKKEVEEIIELYKDDPETLAKKLSESTGFQIILPELDCEEAHLTSVDLVVCYVLASLLCGADAHSRCTSPRRWRNRCWCRNLTDEEEPDCTFHWCSDVAQGSCNPHRGVQQPSSKTETRN